MKGFLLNVLKKADDTSVVDDCSLAIDFCGAHQGGRKKSNRMALAHHQRRSKREKQLQRKRLSR